MITFSPKERFIKGGGKAYVLLSELALDPNFQDALCFALAEYRASLSDPTAGIKYAGVNEFLHVLLNLPDREVNTRSSQNLRPNLNPDPTDASTSRPTANRPSPTSRPGTLKPTQ